MESAIPDFSKKVQSIQDATKWKDKVDIFDDMKRFFKDNAEKLSAYSEAFLMYCLVFTNNCNAANVNIMRSGLDAMTVVVAVCGIGPRCAGEIVPCALNKVCALRLSER